MEVCDSMDEASKVSYRRGLGVDGPTDIAGVMCETALEVVAKGLNSNPQVPAPLNPGVPRAIAFMSTSSATGLSCKYSSKISWRPRTSGLGTTIYTIMVWSKLDQEYQASSLLPSILCPVTDIVSTFVQQIILQQSFDHSPIPHSAQNRPFRQEADARSSSYGLPTAFLWIQWHRFHQ
ncbi:hypothetical protein Cgig2_007935 [Carnegiea gigantea]|uniref:Uncharacterized protein n=1 Tax=Carnegiea gigantea TaxID=171969 RepID=A0A9Q1KG21_9CARY|nr:hypothetical protein Cgig2_007935 [Carnegiea gigantea]